MSRERAPRSYASSSHKPAPTSMPGSISMSNMVTIRGYEETTGDDRSISIDAEGVENEFLDINVSK